MEASDLQEQATTGASAIDEQPSVPERFTICDESTANWVVRKVSDARSYAEHVRAWADAELRRARREEQFFLTRFGSQLEAWLRHELVARGGRRRSINLPAGVLGLRSAPPCLRIIDEATLLAWCRRHLSEALHVRAETSGVEALRLERLVGSEAPESRVTVAVNKFVLNGYFGTTGDVPEGVEVQPREDVLIVR